MPYYHWKGIDLSGGVKKGVLFAPSVNSLDELLLKNEISLLSYKSQSIHFFNKRIDTKTKIQFFCQLRTMLNAGILLPEALFILSSQIHHPYFQDVLAHIAGQVKEGKTLSQTMQQYSRIFNSMMIQMITIAQDSGCMDLSLALLTQYLEESQEFHKNLRSALFVPVCTFAFFCGACLLIFMFVVPQFVHIFQAANQELPVITRLLIAISSFVTVPIIISTMLVSIIISLFLKRMRKNDKFSIFCDYSVLKIPVIGAIIQQSSLIYFLYGISMLTRSGMSVILAIALAKQGIRNNFLRLNIDQLEKEVQSGVSISKAMIQSDTQIFSPQVIAMVRVAEESGKFSLLMTQAAALYKQQVQDALVRFTSLINPMLMILLGLLITLLIFAIYMPIFNLSQAIGN